jgi:hypothetical protein
MTRFIKIEGKEHWINSSKIEEIEIEEVTEGSETFNVYVLLAGRKAWHKVKDNKSKRECDDYVEFLLSHSIT